MTAADLPDDARTRRVHQLEGDLPSPPSGDRWPPRPGARSRGAEGVGFELCPGALGSVSATEKNVTTGREEQCDLASASRIRGECGQIVGRTTVGSHDIA